MIEFLLQNGLIKSKMNGGYRSKAKKYDCNGRTYSGWKWALRAYNGWNTDSSMGDVKYVENVLGRKNEITNLFQECA